MQLNVNDSTIVDSPTPEQIAEAIQSLQSEQYAILFRQDQVYVQTYFNEDGSYELEYRDGGEEKHFAAANPEEVNRGVVCKAFDIFWHEGQMESLLQWQLADLSPPEMDEGEVEYNGVVMDAGWPAQIRGAQEIPSVSLRGEQYARVPFGSESRRLRGSADHCGDCGVKPEQFHVPECDLEQCPKCGGQLMSCGCDDQNE